MSKDNTDSHGHKTPVTSCTQRCSDKKLSNVPNMCQSSNVLWFGYYVHEKYSYLCTIKQTVYYTKNTTVYNYWYLIMTAYFGPSLDHLHRPAFLRGTISAYYVESSWNVMAHGDAREGKWRGNWRMEWVASTLHTTSEHGVSSITIADAHTSAASSRLNWRPCRFKWIRPFRRKTESGFCACVFTFQTQCTMVSHITYRV